MKLLILTQKVDKNDPALGFFCRWIEEFAKNYEKVIVVCLYKGQYDLPENVFVYSLGKEDGVSKLTYIYRFYKYIFSFRKEYDAVFVHMNQIYLVLGGLFWNALKKPVGLWYSHKAKTFSLWLAEKFANFIFTNSKESFTVPTKKANYFGHGIDILAGIRPLSFAEPRDKYAILSVGRITSDKDQKTIIEACEILSKQGIPAHFTFVGAPTAQGDDIYFNNLKKLVKEKNLEDKVVFVGGLPQTKVFPYFWRSNIHINACGLGSLDKTVLEAAAGGTIPVVSNEAFEDILGEYADRLIFQRGDAESLAKCIKNILESDDMETIRTTLEKKVQENFDIEILIKRIAKTIL